MLMRPVCVFVLLALAWAVCSPGLRAQEQALEVGDAGVAFAAADPAYPHMAAWIAAGVPGGIRDDRPVVQSVEVGQDLKEIIEKSAPGVVQLGPGTWELSGPVVVPEGVLVRGVGADPLIQAQTAAAFVLRGTGSGLQGLHVLGPEASVETIDSRHWTNNDAVVTDTALVDVRDATSTILDKITLERTHNYPLILANVSNSTIRNVRVSAPVNRGPGNGAILLQGGRNNLFHNNDWFGLRRIVIDGPFSENVIRDSRFGAGVVFRRQAAAIRANAIESCDWLLPPGYPWVPLRPELEPVGPDNLIMNLRAFHHGTDAVVPGVIVEPGAPYVLEARAARGTYDPVSANYWKAEPIRRLMSIGTTPPAHDRGETIIAAQFSELPAGSEVTQLVNKTYTRPWLRAGPFTTAPDIPATPAVVDGVLAGQSFTWIHKAQPRSGPLSGKERENMLSSRRREREMATVFPPRGGALINLLEQAGGWNKHLILEQMWHIQHEVALEVTLRHTGSLVALTISGTKVNNEQIVRLQPGFHRVVASIHVKKRAPFEKKAAFALSVGIVRAQQQAPAQVPTPAPVGGRLHPVASAETPAVHGARAAADAYFAWFAQSWGPDAGGLQQGLASLIETHPHTTAAWLAGHLHELYAKAPHNEDDPALTAQQLQELIFYFRFNGFPTRDWGLSKRLKQQFPDAPRVREYYLNGKDRK